MDKKRAAAYCRVSTADDLQDGSFEMQMEYYRNFINDHPDFILVDVYGDHGKSGMQIKGRKQFQRMIEDCKNHKIDVIYTKSVSRFARNMGECVKVIRQLRDLGVTVFFEKEDFDTADLRSELILGIMATIAEQESISISENSRWGRNYRNSLGQPIERQSYGYDKIMPGHIWKVNEREKRIVQRAFWMACHGFRYKEIEKELTRMEKQSGGTRTWVQGPVRNLLTNISYTGDLQTNKRCMIHTPEGKKYVTNDGITDSYYIEEHHEPLVSHALFDLVQELIERHLLFSRRSSYSEEEKRLLERAASLADQELGRKETAYAG